jgi:O-antigen ligase
MGRKRQASPATSEGTPDRIARWVLLATVFATMTLVDVRAESGFDAPKRLAIVLGVTLAAAVVAFSRSIRWHVPGGRAAWIVSAGVVVSGVAVLSTVVTPHRAIALEALGIHFALLVAAALAGSSLFDGRWRQVFSVFVAGALVNAVLALLQRAGLRLFAVEQIGGRTEASALIGNDGHLALLAALALLMLAARATGGGRRAGVVAAAIPLLAVVVLTRNVTSILMLLAGGFVLAAVHLPRKRALAAGALVALAALSGIGVLVVRGHGTERSSLDAPAIDRMLSYRFAPWASAIEMTVRRPGLGHGPGSFGVESTAHRSLAEARWHRRLQNPFLGSGSFGEAHNDFLQLAAETGLPAAIVVLAALLLVLVALLRLRDDGGEGVAIAVVVIALAVAALTWFPVHRAATALLLALCAGRGVRILSARDDTVPRPGARIIAVVSTIVLVVAVVPHELRKHSAERALYRMTALAKEIEARGNTSGAAPTLRRIAEEAEAIGRALPGDRRPRVLRGAALLLSGDRDAALKAFRAALEAGESAEIDVNIALALRSGTEARDALVRAVWLSDAVEAMVPVVVRASVVDDVAQRARQLEAGDARAIPPAPRR